MVATTLHGERALPQFVSHTSMTVHACCWLLHVCQAGPAGKLLGDAHVMVCVRVVWASGPSFAMDSDDACDAIAHAWHMQGGRFSVHLCGLRFAIV
eukprot:CAMPEP_0183332896 /NCGR_PEP_ID=MMETSP0164_2-20130417/1950_1 /TAXON_ID=221442 /ORGANISM="Coccolithus pelagicus ssp braarudi, Strain PLY182g" /LENGTH=95 /DNA_ID=CAMNT_0025501705 /DNA_START=191 /DNA_END=478 /DNA_ORIENTATION=-